MAPAQCMQLACANAGRAGKRKFHVEILISNGEQGTHDLLRRWHDLTRALIAAANHLHAARDIDRDHVAMDRIGEELLQSAEDLAGSNDGHSGVPQAVSEVAYAAARELREADAADTALEFLQPGGTLLAFMALGIAADVIADVAFHGLVVLPGHPLATSAAPLAISEVLVGGVLDRELRCIGAEGPGAHLALGRVCEDIGFMASIELAALAMAVRVHDVGGPADGFGAVGVLPAALADRHGPSFEGNRSTHTGGAIARTAPPHPRYKSFPSVPSGVVVGKVWDSRILPIDTGPCKEQNRNIPSGHRTGHA